MYTRIVASSVLSFVVWIILLPRITVELMLAGMLVAVLTGWALGRYAFEGATRGFLDPRRWVYFLVYLFVLMRGILLAGILLAKVILRRDMPIQPGVVAIPTRLRKRWELTLLANSITLTPGTFFLDMNEEERMMYVHWISIKSEAVDEIRRMVTERYERIISKVFG